MSSFYLDMPPNAAHTFHMTAVWRDGNALIVVDRALLVARWSAPPTARQLRTLCAAHAHASQHSERVALLNAVVAVDRPPIVDASVRAGLVALVRSRSAETVAVAHLVCVPGVVGSVVRSFFGAIELLSATRTPTATFGEIEDAAAWLAPRLGDAERAPSDLVRIWRSLDCVHAKAA